MPKARETAVYTHGHHESVLRSHVWRTAENSAGYLLGVLKPRMRILDIGCGPGTITADLAERVPDGHVTGVDHAPDVLERARATAAGRGLTNVDFAVADVHALDYPDDTFCVVHAHQVLQHVGDPVQALREMHRVTKPGGFVAVRDGDYAAMTWYPALPGLDDWLDLYERVARGNGGEPDAGRRIEGVGAGRRADGHHRHLQHVDLRHARGAGLVERPVGGPHPGLGVRRAGRGRRSRHPGTAGGRVRGLAGVGPHGTTPGSRCCTGRFCAVKLSDTWKQCAGKKPDPRNSGNTDRRRFTLWFPSFWYCFWRSFFSASDLL